MRVTVRMKLQEKRGWKMQEQKEKMKIKRESLLYAFRYVYLTAFFFLLSGIFAPIIKGKNYELPFVGVIILYIGLMGGIFLYESTQNEAKKIKYMIVGFTLMSLSTAGIYMVIGF
jgi:hypothetical protein